MSDRRKLGPIRQLSLQTDVRTRPILKKQLSVEQLDAIEEHKPHGVRGVESAKNKLSDRPRPVRVAWAESRQLSRDEPPPPPSRVTRFSDPVEVKKCKEYKRPTTAKLRSQPSIEKESILYTRQELAERLRKAWKDREESKQNLDIFLTHNIQEKPLDDDLDENEHCYSDYERLNDLNNEDKNVSNSDELINNLHNKTVHKAVKQKNSEFGYVPSTTASKPQDVRTNISVTIPSVMQNYKPTYQNQQPESLDPRPVEPETITEITEKKEPERKEHKLVKQTSLINKENDSVLKSLPPRPSTAASKREGFQKRTNTAFNGSLSTSGKDFRPPLARTLSVPVKHESNKPKFIATKRRLKLARRKEKDGGGESGEEFDEDGEKITSKKGSRCKSAPSGELVTMVSLVSPAGSDTEEAPDSKKSEAKSRSVSPVKAVSSGGSNDPPKTITLRKTVKSVSFQQSSIHAVRSFSASFPSRRGSMAAAAATGALGPEREKRAPHDAAPGDNARGPKRRLVRTASSSSQQHTANSFDEDDTQEANTKPVLQKQSSIVLTNETLGVTKAEVLPVGTISTENKSRKTATKEDQDDAKEENEDEEEDNDPETPKFETMKEKECWAMYKKMSDKGLPVSYDTILRGMLTPTEYRSVRKELKTS